MKRSLIDADTAEGSRDGASSDGNWSLFSFTSGPLEDYCVAAYRLCDRIYIYKFDKTTQLSGCANSNYLTQETLVPGNVLRFKAYASIPQGFPGGDTATSVMTFYATGTGI